MSVSWITGVCVQQNRLEWTVLRRMKESWEVSDQGSAPIPESDVPGQGLTAALLKPHLKRFQGKISVALPTDRILVRVALLPSTDAEELRGMAELQTDKFSPFPVESVASGAEVMETSEASSLVAMAVVRRTDVDAAGQAFQEAGALPDVVDVAALGWWWGLQQGDWVPSHGSQIFLRSTADSLDMVLTRDGAPLLFRSLSLPPAEGASAEQSEWLADCSEEVAYSLTSLETEWGGAETPTLHMFHDDGVSTDWADSLQQELRLDSIFIHPLENLPSVSEGVARRLAVPSHSVTMDLAPEAWREADIARRARRSLLRAATLFLVVWLIFIGVFWTWLNVERGQMERLQTEVETVEGPAKEVRRLRTKVQEFTQYANRSHSALECLRIISESLPQGADLTEFIYRKGKTLSLRAIADLPDYAYTFINALEETKHFPEVSSEGITTKGSKSTFGVKIVMPGGEEGDS